MSFSRFIAFKVALAGKKTFSRVIIQISIVAVALSLTVMIATTALIAGFKKEITEKIFGFWGHIHITDANINRTFLETQPIDADQELVSALKEIRGVDYIDHPSILGRTYENITFDKTTKGGIKHIQAFVLKPGIIQTKDQIEGIIVKGVGADFDWDFLREYLLAGQVLSPPDSSSGRKILISKQTADRLHLDVGDKLILHFIQGSEQIKRRFEVCGIYKTGLEEYDKKFALADLGDIQEVLGWQKNQVAGFEIFVENIDDLDIIAEFIYYNLLPNDLYSETIREKFPAIFEWLALQDLNESVIIGLMLVVAIINMITTLLILILERTNMIGILKALGANNWGIRKIFLYYAAYIIGIGLFWGNLAGIGFCLLQKHFEILKLSEADYYISVAPVSLDFCSILFLNIGTLLITVLFLVIPSWLVTRITPVKAIRFK